MVMLLAISSTSFAMSFSQPVDIGGIGFPVQSPYHGYIVKNATKNNGESYYENSNLIITVINLYNDDNRIVINYFVLPLKDLYDINYYSNLQAFGYKNTLGVQFEHKKGNEYRSGFIIFGFGNSTDPEKIDNIFTETNEYIFKPGKYIKVQNNLFCYTLLNIIITDLPEETSNILVQRNNDKKTTLKKGDILSLNEEIIIPHQFLHRPGADRKSVV